MLVCALSEALGCHYKDSFLVFWCLGNPGVQRTLEEAHQICPDFSFWINPEFALVQGAREIPFIPVETAASQTSASF